MNCPKCKAKDSIRYSIQMPYEIIYKLKKDGTPYKRGKLRQLGDSDYDCYYCIECLKEFDSIETIEGWDEAACRIK